MLSLADALGATFVSHSPICRGLLSSRQQESGDLDDVRRFLPRFQGSAYQHNRKLAERLTLIAEAKGCTLAQLSLAWVMAQGENVVPLTGTSKMSNLHPNIGTTRIRLSSEDTVRINEILESHQVEGGRYSPEGMKGVNV